LNGCGLAGEHQQAVAVHVKGEIDEDVDGIGADCFRQLFIEVYVGVSPVIGLGLELVCHRAAWSGVAVAVNFEVFVVVVR